MGATPLFDLDDARAQSLRLTPDVIRAYKLEAFAAGFSLMTAGYRDRLDPEDPWNPAVPFNLVTVAIMATAKARVMTAARGGGGASVHVGGEVRPHTALFVRAAARIYAAHGLEVHLRRDIRSTPIWYSSFGIFHGELDGGENFTASHSAYIKGGWKPLDREGQQLLAEEADVVREVRAIVAEGATLELAADDDASIRGDFDADAAYASYQRSVLGDDLVDTIVRSGARGFRALLYPLGGSMGATSRRLFSELGVSTGDGGVVSFAMDEESPTYYELGHHGDEVEGVDPTHDFIYRNVGVQDRLFAGEADLAILFDADGDRTKLVARAPAAIAERAAAYGLEVERREGSGDCVVFFEPNQLFMQIAGFRIDELRRSGGLASRDWFLCLTHPTSTAIEELGRFHGIPSLRVAVGFKHIGDVCRRIEAQLGAEAVSVALDTGERVELGREPRPLLLCEESGGATLGAAELLSSRSGTQRMLSLREKDGFQIALFTIAMAARLHERGSTVTEAFCEQVERCGVQHLHYRRFDVKLYNESLIGEALAAAKAVGVERRDAVMAYFQGFAERASDPEALEEIRRTLSSRSRDPAPMPKLVRVALAGDGVVFEGEGRRFLLRASGTDALLRYYVEGRRPEDVESWGRMLIAIDPE